MIAARAAVGVLLLAAALAGCKARSPAGAPSCRTNADCAAGAYCSYADGRCGQGRAPGQCQPRPAACAEPHAPVCACDGRAYDSACLAHAAGADLSITGGCRALVRDFIPCGPRYCDAHQSYCEIYLSDVPELPTDHFCRPLPPACLPRDGAAPGCDCFAPGTPCLSFCGPMITGGLQGFHLTCQGVKPPPSHP